MTRNEILALGAGAGVAGLILYPVFMREREPRNSCQGNLKQIGLALHQYAQDYDGRLPPVVLARRPPDTNRVAGPFGWADAAQSYVKFEQVFFCPQAPWRIARGVAEAAGNARYNPARIASSPSQAASGCSGKKSGVRSPARTGCWA